MHKIVIENNGPVRNFEMDINRFNILIGEQATGKSTIAKSVYFFHLIKTTITDFLFQLAEKNRYDGEIVDKRFNKMIANKLKKEIFVRLFGPSWRMESELKMQYFFSDEIWIQADLSEADRVGERYVGVTYSPALMRQVKRLEKQAEQMHDSLQNGQISLALADEEKKRNRQRIVHEVNAVFGDEMEVYYIPAGRSLLTVMSDNNGILSRAANLDLITEKFLAIIDSVRGKFAEGVKQAHRYYGNTGWDFDDDVVSRQLIDMLKGEYFYLNGREEVLKISKSPETIKINFASSGQQEVLWLLNLLYILMLKKERAFVVIEEPEAHLYPSMQKKLMEYIALFANVNQSTVFLTTHSPYLLSVASNLFYAGNLMEKGAGGEVLKIVDENTVIPSKSLSAYKLQENQEYENLLNESQTEINSYLIDEVSDEVNEVYTSLYGVGLGYE